MSFPLVKLSEVSKTTSGGTPSRKNEEYFGGDIPWVKSGDLKDTVVSRSEETITQKGLNNSSAKLFPKGTLLIAMYGATVGKLGILDMDATTNQAICGITPQPCLDTWFLFYFLRSIRDNLINRSVGGAQPNISQKIIRNISIPLPPLSEQRRIVDILNHANGIRRLRREAQEKARQLIPALFIEMFDDPASNPMGWPSPVVGEVLTVRGGKRLPKGVQYADEPTAFRYLRGVNIKAGYIDVQGLAYLRPEVQRLIRRYTISVGDVIITIAGKIGVAVPVSAELAEVNLTENAAKLTPMTSGQIDAVFLSWLLNSDFVQGQIQTLTGRVTIGKLALERIKKIRILIPPYALQTQFAERVADIQAVIAQQDRMAEASEEMMKALMAQAFEGDA